VVCRNFCTCINFRKNRYKQDCKALSGGSHDQINTQRPEYFASLGVDITLMAMNETFLIETVKHVPEIMELLEILRDLNLPNHFIAGGSVTQCVWNRKLGNPLLYKVKDFDVVFFDTKQSVSESDFEREIEKRKSFFIPVDVKNQANVHKWYGSKFGNDIEPLSEAEDGIRMWTPCFAVGIRLIGNYIDVFAPFGLEDQADMRIRPNKLAMSKANYDSMNLSFKERWPDLEIEAW
jgi:hypothetical protein